jgi:SAM-dependent methyltransferase
MGAFHVAEVRKMSIMHERPTPRRMMMHFDQQFLAMLPTFKKGFRGNETQVLYEEMRLLTSQHRKTLNILDVGSADGDRLGKLTSIVWDQLDIPDAAFTALEPIQDNQALTKVCKDKGLKWAPDYLEESDLDSESFDMITSTHSAYYYYNQPLAHEELFRVLKPGGKLIVTLVSRSCVLNCLTEELLGPHRQFALNAESYITMVGKLGLFSLEKVVSVRGGLINHTLYTNSEANLRALQYVLSRHRLPVRALEESLGSFAKAVQTHQWRERINLIMFFEKVKGRFESGNYYENLSPEVLDQIGLLSSTFSDMATKLSPDAREVLMGDLETFTRVAGRRPLQSAFLRAAGDRLKQAALEARGGFNELQEQIDGIITKLSATE